MNLRRMIRHLSTGNLAVRAAFPARALHAIERAIRETEAAHSGQVRFAVEASLDFAALRRNQTASERAIEMFSQLRVWDTEHNNGVLIYLLLADRDVEIVADRGIHARLGNSVWEAICRDMEAAFRQGEFEAGVTDGIRAIGNHLQRHFPAEPSAPNELPDKPIVL
ncbi:MAG: TPM domain-containing protein [Nitrosomonadales bacterium]|nr:TPM domain-containing protein [Nitrosomonadales bacterium]